ncbi:MAG TPA: hypothetical protein DDW76_17220 [Cyanobacteria bacterium UBA11369]|nr:hypothetical protein [Cyanobacteria bacterium UBA11371]HBE31097.1 hypothetical protein [Cyanobacteria bacterium UBA11368]HBE50485.1 hypothetical protein [Cyanobacteria bacterium UBA11369]
MISACFGIAVGGGFINTICLGSKITGKTRPYKNFNCTSPMPPDMILNMKNPKKQTLNIDAGTLVLIISALLRNDYSPTANTHAERVYFNCLFLPKFIGKTHTVNLYMLMCSIIKVNWYNYHKKFSNTGNI